MVLKEFRALGFRVMADALRLNFPALVVADMMLSNGLIFGTQDLQEQAAIYAELEAVGFFAKCVHFSLC